MYVARSEPDVTWTIGVDLEVGDEVEVEYEDLVDATVDVASGLQSSEVLLLKG